MKRYPAVEQLDDRLVAAVEVTAEPMYGRTASGYGRKLPTRYMLTIGKRQHRVYAVCFSNVASFYVVLGGEKRYLEIATEHRIEDAVDADMGE